MTTDPDLRAWLETGRQAVDAALESYLPRTDDAPPIVCEAMRYSLFAGGKRLRPLLALAAAEAVSDAQGQPAADARDLAMPVACALELIHTYSLVHDDLPAMDDDTMRRGRPTAHVVFGEGMAILAGDALLTEAFVLLAREPAHSAAVSVEELNRRKLRASAIVAEAAGAAGMVGGQAIDLQAAIPGAPALDERTLRDMHSRKTGALIGAAALGGAVMGGATAPLVEAIRQYAGQIGLAFQIVDDILDVEGASVELGKTAGKDAAAGKPTYPSLYGLSESRRLAAECLTRALAALDAGGLGGRLPGIAEWVIGRSH